MKNRNYQGNILNMVLNAFKKKSVTDDKNNICMLGDEIYQLKESLSDENKNYQRGMLVRKIAKPSNRKTKPGEHENMYYCYVCGFFNEKAEFFEVPKNKLKYVGSVNEISNLSEILGF